MDLAYDSFVEAFRFYNVRPGTIPSEIGRLSKLRKLILENGVITGSVPTELGGLFQLGTIASLSMLVQWDCVGRQILMMYYNQFLSTELLDLHGIIKLTGKIPEEVCSLFTEGNLIAINVTESGVSCNCCSPR